MLLLDWFSKPEPKVYEVPGVGPKPVKDWTDEDVEAVARPFHERAEQLSMPLRIDFTRLVLQMREEEREWLATSRLELGLERLRDSWGWDWIWWRLRGSQHFADASVQIDVSPPDLLERSRFARPDQG